ncbi:MAG TPA: alpha/beta hydrolase [Sphingobium sp.]|uniref:alpha/beta hydrolase n=1 Tax=Sphingobium sp. TaxID=1912891 RepID=UPI002ED192EC
MNSRHLVDPELLEWIDQLPPIVFSEESLPFLRQGMAEATGAFPIPEGLNVAVEDRMIAGGDGQPMALVIYRPLGITSPVPSVLQIHGGGYILGSARMSDIANRVLAATLGCIVVAVDYRLAPETPHPGPVEDCYAALKWLVDEADALSVDPSRIALQGESAGGGLAAACALLARDRGGPSICHQHLIYPMLDDRTCTRPDPHPYTGEFVWNADANYFGWRSLLGCEPGSEHVSPYAAAARAEDLKGLPSTFISAGALDLFVEEDIDFARRLLRAGVPTELHLWPGAYHGFEANPGAQVTIAAGETSMKALRRALAR